MSRVIIDSQPGDGLYVLESFNASPKGEAFSWDTAKEFITSQRVKYVDFRWKDSRDQYDHQNLQPTWMITFEDGGVQYEATHDYFITQDAWAGLMRVFGNQVKKTEPKADNKSTGRDWNWLLTLVYIVMLGWFIWLVVWMLYGLKTLGQ